MERKAARIIDANLNRVREGLRVCEDICRFLYDLPAATQGYKRIRHAVTQSARMFPVAEIVTARDVRGDIGRPTLAEETPRETVYDIFYANSQRVKESIRVLEEFAKLTDAKAAEPWKRMRYRVYLLEKDVVKVMQFPSRKR